MPNLNGLLPSFDFWSSPNFRAGRAKDWAASSTTLCSGASVQVVPLAGFFGCAFFLAGVFVPVDDFFDCFEDCFEDCFDFTADLLCLPAAAFLPKTPILSKSANSSSGETSGWVSLSPLFCVTSRSGSQRARVFAYAAVKGFMLKSVSANIRPLARLPLWGMARTLPPTRLSYSSR